MSRGIKQTIKEGFEKFVIRNKSGCWGWSGCSPKNPGYGQFRYGMKLIRAHRASWIIHFGAIPKGKCVLHKCDNKLCSNPDHLFLGTHKENALDMLHKNYHPTLGKKHEDNHMAILKKIDIPQIRKLIIMGDSLSAIANIFKVSKGAIAGIKYNKTWKGV